MKALTIFTPTYNRGYILPRLYESLCKECPTDFVWLIVDDGSTDNTQALVNEWRLNAKIEIKYHFQKNGGKMRAHNRGVQLCETPLFFCIDSDDAIAQGAVKRILMDYKLLENDETLSGRVARRQSLNRSASCDVPNVGRCSLHDIYERGFFGDTSLVFKTSILREYPFPEIEGEKFITESYVYDQIDQKYELIIENEYLMRCEYLDDGYTANSINLYFNYPKGWALYYSQYYRLYAKTLWNKIKYLGYYISMCMISKTPFFVMLQESPSPILTLFSIPAGVKFYHRFIREKTKS